MFEIPVERIIEINNKFGFTSPIMLQVFWRSPWLLNYKKCSYMFPGDRFTIDPSKHRFYRIGGVSFWLNQNFQGVSSREYLIFEQFSGGGGNWDYVDLSATQDGQQLLRAELQKDVEEHELSKIDLSKLQNDISELKNEIEGLKNYSISLGSTISPSNFDFSAVKLN